jgi:hypothetical protein
MRRTARTSRRTNSINRKRVPQPGRSASLLDRDLFPRLTPGGKRDIARANNHGTERLPLLRFGRNNLLSFQFVARRVAYYWMDPLKDKESGHTFKRSDDLDHLGKSLPVDLHAP